MEGLDSVERSELSPEIKPKEISDSAGITSSGDAQHVVMNGYSNGLDEKHIKKEHKDHKDKHRDKERDRDKYKDKHKEHRDREKDKERSRDKDKEKSKDKEKERSKDKERDREKDKSRDRDKDRDRHRDKEREKHSSSSKDKDKHGSGSDREKKHKEDRDKEKRHHDKEVKSSSSSKDKSSSSRDKDRDREREKDKERKDKHSSSNSSSHKDKDKDKHSSSKDKDRHKEKDKSSSSREKEKHKESSSDKERSKEESDKDRNKEGDKKKHSSDKDRHKDKVKEKEKHSESREKNKDSKHKEEKLKEPKVEKDEVVVKQEVVYNQSAYMKPESISPQRIKQESISPQRIKHESISPQRIKHEPQDPFTCDSYNSIHNSSQSVKTDPESEDDLPLAQRSTATKVKRERIESDDDDDIPLSARKKIKKPAAKKRKKTSDDEEDFKPVKKAVKKEKPKVKNQTNPVESPRKRKKEEEEQEVWKWWEEEKRDDGVKWTYLEHKGPVFAPGYEKLPDNVKFYYDGKEMKLSESAEEVATFYARMLDHDYTTKEAFNTNFFKDWKKCMTSKEQEIIKDLSKCNFTHMHSYFQQKSEERKQMSKEEKKKIKEQNEEITKEYGFCVIDGHKEKIGNFRIEPPGLFRGRGEHPKMGKLKKRVNPEDVIINCSKNSPAPQPPEGHKWKEVRHDNNVTWLASWTENVQGQTKYIMLNPSSKLKGEKDWQKYETARKLAKYIDKIRENYREDWKSKEMRIRQRAVALYFIDKLALRAGNEKDEDQADTVGCCSLRVEHITLHEERDGKQYVVVFDFLGKDSIRYVNEVPVEKRVFKNVQLFMENKRPGDDLFDRLNTAILNKHLNELMEGLTAKVFRTYNASFTLQAQLDLLTNPDDNIPAKILSYNRANRAVAILCNHQRSVPKTHEKSMENLNKKMEEKKEHIAEAEKQYKQAKKAARGGGGSQMAMEKKKKALDRLKEQLTKLEVQATDKEENKQIALGTSKLNYLDPRISVAWCKKYNVPIEKIYNKTQRQKFRWAIDMAGADYVF